MDTVDLREPNRKWSAADYAGFVVLVAGALILFCSGLSLKSLWGSEGRWAVIAREMMQTGNYFLPTINGQVYFDKPLLSYWAIIPFSWFAGVTEASARLPGALAGAGTVGLIFALGRRLFGRTAGFLAGTVLLTTVMFGFWARTASAELLNVLAIWLMFAVLADRGRGSSFRGYLIFYMVAAVSSFCKGPVAPAVALTTIIALSVMEAVFEIRRDGFKGAHHVLSTCFGWIFSLKGFFAALCGLALFAILLFLPVIVTGSWDAVSLMWRENVTRFFKPFDHVEPFYTYFKHIPIFLLPWTFVAIGSLVYMGKWEAGWQRRWTLCVTIAIFIFFTVSGSRRSYYILPIVPAFALIMGRSLDCFFSRVNTEDSRVMKAALAITGILPILAGIAMVFLYFRYGQYRHISEIVMGPAVIAAGAAGFLAICRRKFFEGTVVAMAVFFGLFLWGHTAGGAIGERQRTLKPFADELTDYFRKADYDKLAMYNVGNSSLIFYLDRQEPIKAFDDTEELCTYVKKPGNYLLMEEGSADEVLERCTSGSLVRVLSQPGEGKKHDRERLVLFLSGKEAQNPSQ